MSGSKIVFLDQSKIPTNYYNILADMPEPMAPPLHPGTKEPIGPNDLSAIFPMELIMQEVATDRFIEIPDEVLELYKMHRRIITRELELKSWLLKPERGSGEVHLQWHVNILDWSAKSLWLKLAIIKNHIEKL